MVSSPVSPFWRVWVVCTIASENSGLLGTSRAPAWTLSAAALMNRNFCVTSGSLVTDSRVGVASPAPSRMFALLSVLPRTWKTSSGSFFV